VIQVRRARSAREIARCKQLHEATFEGSPLPQPSSVWWVAVAAGEIVGFASARLLEDSNALLNSAGVLRSWRGQGIQKRLIRARVRWAQRAGARRAVTYTMPHNAPSANSLIRCGFRHFTPAVPWFRCCGQCEESVVYWARELT
jgi:GNAT superfamily N-acetyltransferase